MSKSTFLQSEPIFQYEDLNDLNFTEDPFNFCFNSLLSPKLVSYSFEDPEKVVELPIQSTINANLSSETLNDDGNPSFESSYEPSFKYSVSKIFQTESIDSSWDDSTINFDFHQVADDITLKVENESRDEDTTDQDIFKFLQAENDVELTKSTSGEQVEGISELTRLLQGEPEAQSFQDEIGLTDFEYTEFPGMEDILKFSKSQFEFDESTLGSDFPIAFPSFGPVIRDLWNNNNESDDVLNECFSMHQETVLQKEGNLEQEPDVEQTSNFPGVACTHLALPLKELTTTVIKKSPNQYHSPPKRMYAVGKSKLRRGSYNEHKRSPFDYSKVKLENLIVQTNNLRNFAYVKPPVPIEELVKNKVIRFKNSDNDRITQIKRTRYIRGDLSSIASLYPNVRYEKNPCFGLDRPYEPEFISYEVDTTSELPYNETRCGLCPYCPDLKFRNFKTSTYSQHLALWHGIHTDNYLTPNPSHYGVYKLSKDKNIEKRKTIAHLASKNGVVCPVCHDIIETECSKSTLDKPLSGYLRHFRDHHRRSNFKWDPYQYFTITVE